MNSILFSLARPTMRYTKKFINNPHYRQANIQISHISSINNNDCKSARSITLPRSMIKLSNVNALNTDQMVNTRQPNTPLRHARPVHHSDIDTYKSSLIVDIIIFASLTDRVLWFFDFLKMKVYKRKIARPLHIALMKFNNPNLTEMDKLLKKGLVNTVNQHGETPLHIAIKKNHDLHILDKLMIYRADINAVDNNGMTPLHLSVIYNSDTSKAEYLIKSGVKVSARDNKGFTALDIAILREYKKMENLLRVYSHPTIEG